MPLTLTDCPRDAMQGLADFIPTDEKVRYINALLRTGFDVLDCVSFVSPKAIPQLRDSGEVLARLDNPGRTKLLAIVLNERGALDALSFPEIDILGFPFSISPTFALRNGNQTLDQQLANVEKIANHCAREGRTPLVYLSMGFGNPYGDAWSPDLLDEWAARMAGLGVKHILLADTLGGADPAVIRAAFERLIPQQPGVEFGAHFHATPATWRAKVEAAWLAGCRRFDGALRGYGGCPMAADELTGNVATENLLAYAREQGESPAINDAALANALRIAGEVLAH